MHPSKIILCTGFSMVVSGGVMLLASFPPGEIMLNTGMAITVAGGILLKIRPRLEVFK